MNNNLLLETARRLEIKAFHDANTEEAIERSVFRAPTYFVGERRPMVKIILNWLSAHSKDPFMRSEQTAKAALAPSDR